MTSVIKEYAVKKVKIANLKFDETNPNKMTKEQEEALKNAFHRFGYLVPIVINEKNEIGDGEHRATVYKEMGIKQIPAYIVPKINNDIKRRLLRQTMNKLKGTHDVKMDATEIELIFKDNKLDDLTALLAKDRSEFEQLLTKHKGIPFQNDDDFDVDKALEESKTNPITKLGDMWQLGNHRIICADCTDHKSVDRLTENKKIEMVFTDPPYNLGFDYNTHDDKMSKKDYFFLCKNMFDNVKRKISKFIITPGPRNITQWYDIAGDPKDIGIWYKSNSSTYGSVFMRRLCEPILFFGEFKRADKRSDDWFNYSRSIDSVLKKAEGENSKHNAPSKPIRLVVDIIKHWSKECHIIMDPFLGSASTLIACEQTNRICYGIELDPHYVDVCVKRWEVFTGKKAKKLN